MRVIMIDWLVDVHANFKLRQETLFIAIHIIDTYLSMTLIKRSKLQLVGITALFIAAKYEEIFPPQLVEFSETTDNAFKQHDILHMESSIIIALDFVITVPTSNRFAEWYIRLAHFSEKEKNIAFYFIELALLNTLFLKYPPSLIAASAVYLVNKLNKSQPSSSWSDLLEHDSGYTEYKLRPCAKDLINIQ